jgi:pilus assembly protein CpaB
MFVLAAVAFLVALGVSLFTYRELSRRLKPAGEDTMQLVVAALPVHVGAKLTEADLRLTSWPRAIPIEGSYQQIADVVGRGVLVPMVPNEPVLASKLAGEGSGAGLTSTIPDGMRAVSIKVNDVIGVAGFVVPGTRVDVILSGSPNSQGEISMSKVILENIQVLTAGQNLATDDTGQPLNVQVVTLLVSPEQSQTLALAQVDGRIQLALRNPMDLRETNPNVTRRENLFAGGSSSPIPAPVVAKPVARTTPKAATKAVAPPPVPPSVVVPPPIVMAAPAQPAPPPTPAAAAPIRREIQVISGDNVVMKIFETTAEAAE